MNSPAPPEDAATAAGPAAIYGVVLSVGVVCALLIATVFELTRPIVERNRIAMTQAAILEVLPAATDSVTFVWDESAQAMKPAEGDGQPSDAVFAGFDGDGNLVGLAITAEGMGYQDVVRVLYGCSLTEQAVVGMRVLESRETPGLGDRVETDEKFLKNFERLDVRLNDAGDAVAQPIEFVKPGEKSAAWQIDGISGATITSRAIADMLRESTARWMPRVQPRSDQFRSASRETEQ